MNCNKCGQSVLEIASKGRFLKRINPIGDTPFIGECYPSCDDDAVYGNQETAFILSIEDPEPEKEE